MATLSEGQFHDLVDTLQQQLEDWFDRCGLDLDIDNSGGILTIEFANGSQLIFSRQTALLQLWLAARSGGYHFDYAQAQKEWINDADGLSLTDWIVRLVRDQTGETVDPPSL